MTTDDRFKLLMHRMIARRLDASAIAVARARVAEIDDGRDAGRNGDPFSDCRSTCFAGGSQSARKK